MSDIVADLGLTGTVPPNPAAAQARLEALKADQTWTKRLLSGDSEAGAEFDRLSRQAASSPAIEEGEAVDAARQLASLIADPEWGAKLLRGDAEANRQFRELGETAAAGGWPIHFEAAPNNSGVLPTREARLAGNVMAWLADRNIFDPLITVEALGRMSATSEEHQRAGALKRELMTDKEFVAKFLGGDAAAVRKMTLVDIILSKPLAA
jgi:hypothetical protein